MEKADALFIGTDKENKGFMHEIQRLKLASVSDAEIEVQCHDFARLLSLLDCIWSMVRGIEAGLLPTATQLQQLDKAIKEGKQMWLRMGISTQQPKWHLTFDGHLMQQVTRFGGLADKADDTIEFQHQVLKTQRKRYRSISSYQLRETSIKREIKRGRSAEIQSHLDKYHAKMDAAAAKRKRPASETKEEAKRKEKRLKREATLDLD